MLNLKAGAKFRFTRDGKKTLVIVESVEARLDTFFILDDTFVVTVLFSQLEDGGECELHTMKAKSLLQSLVDLEAEQDKETA